MAHDIAKIINKAQAEGFNVVQINFILENHGTFLVTPDQDRWADLEKSLKAPSFKTFLPFPRRKSLWQSKTISKINVSLGTGSFTRYRLSA